MKDMMKDMTDIQQWLAAARDGALAPDELALVQTHLAECRDCAAHQAAAGELGIMLHDITYYQAPPQLAGRIRAALQEAIEVERAPMPAEPAPSAKIIRFPRAYRWATSIAAAAACLMLAWNVSLQMQSPDASPMLEQVVDDHVRSLMADHLMDVASSSQHTVKPWFSGKLDVAPPVEDFADQGFALLGGRLDYLGGRVVPALVYRHNEHIINMFVLPDGAGDTAPRHMAARGYAALTWAKGGLTYWAVCDMSPAELEKLASLTIAAPDSAAIE
jgi:anti-sigma factor RsiW